MQASDLPSYMGKRVIVQVDTSQDTTEDDFKEVEGKVAKADAGGLVLETREGVQIIPMDKILDVDLVVRPPSKRLVVRWLRDSDVHSVRQHLVDRHGYPFDLVSAKGALSPEQHLEVHSHIDHTNLGHRHGAKPPSNRTRRTDLPEGVDEVTSEE